MPRTSIKYEKKCMGRGYVDVDCSFAPNGSSAVAATSNRGRGLYAVTRTGAGVFDVEFTDDFIALVSGSGTLQLASADDKYIQLGTFTAATSTARAKIVVRIMDISGAAADDVAANANNRVNLRFTFRSSSVTP